MASVEEVKVNVAASVEGAQRAVAGIQQASDQLDQSLVLLRMTAVGSFHPAAATAIANLEQAKSRLEEAVALTVSAMDSANTFRSLI
ncbi:hydrogenase maturation factor HypF (carbamoyltransferase family) [Actinoplanes lutulentus]|uniref:Type VII secretion system (Wss) protein ESAT-6 n=1 Tax=Actinoplanes lutulentus TaxID=1287878 RepID=A0A327ZHJ2_9ACTN|nr:hypothetical protein [Actinoplanes lutulentus]MBB2945694.1 hydrogenase maturation factor HypF (carbamoyltransferase family) [Actinoplanes lutulentus]RAK37743.1 hypothetical protein B0I29_1069 [Actinoplanes lutulentus]